MPGQGGLRAPRLLRSLPPRDIFEQKMMIFQCVDGVLDLPLKDVRAMG